MILKQLTWTVLFFALFVTACGGGKTPGAGSDTTRAIGPAPAGMVLIPGGTFSMGADSFDEGPRHKIRIDSFFIDVREVTNRQYWEFVTATGHPPAPFFRDSVLGRPDHPVVGVSYDDARAYAFWLNKRLPTEAEWEYAARGGLKEKDYPWGNDPPNGRCNFAPHGKKNADGWAFTSPVGRYKANNYGLYDMSGNAWEWCSDFYDSTYYQRSPERNPVGPDSGYTRVLRGGSWLSINPKHLKCSSRLELKPYIKDRYYGFRCAKTP